MAVERFRTGVSVVYWTETPEQSEAISAAINEQVPEIDQTATITTVEYVSTGRPDLTDPAT